MPRPGVLHRLGRLDSAGFAVGGLDLDEARCGATVATIEEAGGCALSIGCDIANELAVNGAILHLREALGPIAVLVNNAAITGFVPSLAMTLKQWDRCTTSS